MRKNIFKKIFIGVIGLTLLLNSLVVSAAYESDFEQLQKAGAIEQTIQSDTLLTRAMFAKILLKNAGFNPDTYTPTTRKRFYDVKLENPYAPYVYKLLELGVIKIPDGVTLPRFNPSRLIPRKDALEWIFALNSIPVPLVFDTSQFQATDISYTSRIAPLINKAITLGLLSPGKVEAYATLTGGFAAHFIKVAKSPSPTLTVTIVPTVQSDLEQNVKYQILATTWNKIMQNYLHRDTVNRDNLVYGAVDGMVKELGDKHSDFERPDNTTLVDSLSGTVEGIGAVIQEKDGQIIVVTPLADSPAEKAGIIANDIIIEVNGTSVAGMKLTEVAALIKGKSGTQVTLTIKRLTRTLSFTITRQVIKVISASLTRTDDNMAIIKLSNFGENTNSEMSTIVTSLRQNKPNGIVLDLRNNPGGYLTTAIYVAGFFIKSGDKVTSVKYPDHEDVQNSTGSGELATYRIMVLTNGGSASASEILAGGLQDYALAKVVGEKTYGKGTVQELSQFLDGSTLKLTVAEWLTPKGRSIEKNGITPDIAVTITDEDRAAGKDPQLDRALVELRK